MSKPIAIKKLGNVANRKVEAFPDNSFEMWKHIQQRGEHPKGWSFEGRKKAEEYNMHPTGWPAQHEFFNSEEAYTSSNRTNVGLNNNLNNLNDTNYENELQSYSCHHEDENDITEEIESDNESVTTISDDMSETDETEMEEIQRTPTVVVDFDDNDLEDYHSVSEEEEEPPKKKQCRRSFEIEFY